MALYKPGGPGCQLFRGGGCFPGGFCALFCGLLRPLLVLPSKPLFLPVPGKIVFGNSKKLRKLESINYPYIEDKIYKLINSTDKDVIIEAALIMRSEIYKMCDSLIYVNSKTSDIIKRMRKSRNISEKEARKILKMQIDVKNKKFNADIIINNMRDYNHLIIVSKKLGRHYGTKSKSKQHDRRRKRIFY